MDNLKELFALAKLLGYSESFESFKSDYKKIYDSEFPSMNGTVNATKNPFRQL